MEESISRGFFCCLCYPALSYFFLDALYMPGCPIYQMRNQPEIATAKEANTLPNAQAILLVIVQTI